MIERLFEEGAAFYRNRGARAGTWRMVGQDPVSGRKLVVAIRWRDPDAGVLAVVTAFDSDK